MPKDMSEQDELIAELRRLWVAKPYMSNIKIGEALGRSHSWVQTTAEKIGLERRGHPDTKIDKEKFIELAKAGHDRQFIGQYFDVSPSTVTSTAKRLRVKITPVMTKFREAAKRLTYEVMAREWADRSRTIPQLAKDNGVSTDIFRELAHAYDMPPRTCGVPMPPPRKKAVSPVPPSLRRKRRRLTAIPPEGWTPPQPAEPKAPVGRWTPEVDDAIRATGGIYKKLDAVADKAGIDRKSVHWRWVVIKGDHCA